jgi:hypothetical protein
MFVGIDWASETHTVGVVDDAGAKLASFQITHTADGFGLLVGRLRRLGTRPSCRSPSSGPTVAWSTGCWRPATRSCRSSPRRSGPGGRTRSQAGPKATRVTPR